MSNTNKILSAITATTTGDHRDVDKNRYDIDYDSEFASSANKNEKSFYLFVNSPRRKTKRNRLRSFTGNNSTISTFLIFMSMTFLFSGAKGFRSFVIKPVKNVVIFGPKPYSIISGDEIVSFRKTGILCNSCAIMPTHSASPLVRMNLATEASIEDEEDSSSSQKNIEKNKRDKSKSGRVRYMLGTDVNVDPNNWVAPAPVVKTDPGNTTAIGVPTMKQKQIPSNDTNDILDRESKYNLGIGKNSPIHEMDTHTNAKIVAKNAEGKFLSRALWLYGENKGQNGRSPEAAGETVLQLGDTGRSSALPGLLDNGKDNSNKVIVENDGANIRDVEERNASQISGTTSTSDDNQVTSTDRARNSVMDHSKNQQQQYRYQQPPIIQYDDIDQSIPKSVYSSEPGPNQVDLVWSLMKNEAKHEAEREPLLVSFLYSTILNHPTLESALAFHLANRLSSPAMISTQIMGLILEALEHNPTFQRSLRADILAVRDRDPACTCLPDVFLYFKGFHALQTHRVAHYLWKSGRRTLAHYLQSQMSQNFQIDIHPNATLGDGIMLDHGTGIVIGETAVVGHNCSILHHVTLGGSGKRGLDRHPKVGNGVLLGAGSSVLGNIQIGDGCQVGAGTLVIGDLPPHSVAVGVPAKIIGTFLDEAAQPSTSMNQLGSKESAASIVTFETEGI